MYTRRVTYTDFNGNERTETYHFRLTKSELIEMELGREGTFTGSMQKIIDAKDTPTLIKEFKRLVRLAYGEKSEDGRRFIKSETLSDAFCQTEAYDEIFMSLVTDDEEAAKFINAILPSDISKAMDKDGGKTLDQLKLIDATAADTHA